MTNVATSAGAVGRRPFHVLTKPIGPICNLDCSYCFYLEKEAMYAGEKKWRMSEEVLERYVREYIAGQPGDGGGEVRFAWQGGEPTLLGVDFFRRVVEVQKKFGEGRKISNALQTNGTLLDDEWCAFLTEQEFLVGLSVDGPRELHDRYRVDKKGAGTFEAVMRGLRFLQKHGTAFNTLTVVNRGNGSHPLEVYRFLKSIGSGFLQFIPLVEREAPVMLKVRGFDFAAPPVAGAGETDGIGVTPWSVTAAQYGAFLCAIFDEWVRKDVGRTFVQLFDTALGNWMGLGSALCVFAEKCGRAVAIEHNGDVYSCDHYVYPEYKLGNVMDGAVGALATMIESARQVKFGADKSETLPRYCRECTVRFACNGECPKHRFIRTPDGEAGLNYLCGAYKKFFTLIDPYMRVMADLARRGEAPAAIMGMLREEEAARAALGTGVAGRNDACPCGSGRKYKKCCGR
ncbi:MAG TPA: anaerobic sulfatase maturase [Phycisphaerae bacterium]|nr:anaerobic sulfatase maturase [Phycisphaerae bacterium]